MRLNSNPFLLILGVILIFIGVMSLLNYRIYPTNHQMAIGMLILAGIVVLVVVNGWVKESMGLIITTIWLVLMGLGYIYNLHYTYETIILSLLPLGAGLFMLMGL